MANKSANSIGPLFLLFLVFLVLKLTHVIAWSWWLVTMPMWAPLGLAVVCVAAAALCYWVADKFA